MATSLLIGCVEPPDTAPLNLAMQERPVRVKSTLAKTSFGKSVAGAVQRDPQVARGNAAIIEAEAEVMVRDAARFPGVSLSLGLPIGGGGITPALTLSQTIFDAGAGKSRISAAKAQVIGRKSDQIESRSIAALDAVESWANVVTTRKLVAAAKELEKGLVDLTVQIKTLSDAGAGSIADLFTARSRLENERASIAEIQMEMARARAVFTEVFEHAPSSKIGLPPQAPIIPKVSADGSPLMFSALAQKLVAEAQLTETKSRLFPSVSLGVEAPVGSDPSISASSTSTQLSPINGRKARLLAAQARVDSQALEVKASRLEIKRRISVTRAQLDAAKNRLTISKRAVKVNMEGLNITRQQFVIGQSSLLEVLDSEREAFFAKQMEIKAAHDVSILRYALLAITGDIVDLFAVREKPEVVAPSKKPNQLQPAKGQDIR